MIYTEPSTYDLTERMARIESADTSPQHKRKCLGKKTPGGQAAQGKDQHTNRIDLSHQFGAIAQTQQVEVEDDRVDATVDGKANQRGR